MDYYENEEEIEAVVTGFESCATAKEDFKHRNHLTVAVWYLLHSPAEEAVERMREGLLGSSHITVWPLASITRR